MKKRITIDVDLETGEIDLDFPDEMMYKDAISALEYTKELVMRDWMKDLDDK